MKAEKRSCVARVVSSKLTDGSFVFDVRYRNFPGDVEITIACVNEPEAYELAEALNKSVGITVEVKVKEGISGLGQKRGQKRQ